MTLTLPLISVSGAPSLDNSATISGNGGTQYYPNESRDFGNPLENGRVNVTVQSDYYRAWGAYFTDRTDGSVSYDHADDEVTITLVIPAENDPVTAGIVSGGAGTTLANFWVYMRQGETATFVNNAEFTGVIYGPGTASNPGVEFGLSNNAEVWGGLVGDADSIDNNNVVVHYDGAVTQTTSVQRDRTVPALTYMHVSVNRVNVSSR